MKTVFFDIDTQIDFLFPAGALYVRGGERLIPTISALNRHALKHKIPLISTMDAHSENDAEFLHWPPHCVVGTIGQQKPAALLGDQQQIVPAHKRVDPATLAPQVLLEKDKLDCFTNHNLPPILDQLGAERYVVYGVATEHCVQAAVLGLLRRGGRVEVVRDAIEAVAADASAQVSRLESAGAILVTSSEILNEGVRQA